jgi:NADPH:quinone reductase-like Zn-dependent oxidoreductase
MYQVSANAVVRDKEETQMKAIVYTHYGPPDVLVLKEVEKPTPQDNEVLVKVHAASVNAAELHFLRADPFLMRFMGYGLLKPKHTILGVAMAGRVEALGRNVTQFQPGDEISTLLSHVRVLGEEDTSYCEHSHRILTSHWKWCCPGKVSWQRKKEENRYDPDRTKDTTRRPASRRP